jgi:hypothetical protein
MVGLTALVVLILVAVDVAVLSHELDRRGRGVSGGLGLLLVALMTWQLATHPAGLGRLGWSSVGVEIGRSGQVLVVALLLIGLGGAGVQLTSRWSAASQRIATSLSLIAALGSVAVAFTSFVE